MSYPLALGWEPIEVTALFSMGQDWIVQLIPTPPTPSSPLYPDGTTVTAYIYPDSTDTGQPADTWTQLAAWVGAIDETGTIITWRVSSSETDVIPDGALLRIRISYPNTPDADLYNWAKGFVRRND